VAEATVGAVAFDAVGERLGMADQVVEGEVRGRWAGPPRLPTDDVRRAAPQQRHRAPGVAPLEVRQPDRELRQPPPQLPLGGLGGLPRGLQHLVGVERHPLVEQPLGLVHALLRAEHQVVRHPLDPDRATRQRAAGGVAGGARCGTARGVAVALVGHAVHRATGTAGCTVGTGGREAMRDRTRSRRPGRRRTGRPRRRAAARSEDR
jgi:hypothetical protein